MILKLTLFHFIALFVLIIILFLLEFNFPLRKRKHSFLFRIITNGLLSLLVFFTVFLIIQPAQEIVLNFTGQNNFGLLHLFNFPTIVESILAFLLMDLAFYYWHLLNHKIPLLWRFHNVHHCDPDLDISTAFRFHFGEITFSTLFRIIQISIIGVTPVVFIIYEIFFTANTIFQHSNIKLSIKIERIINKIIVTPRMHGIHHSQYRTETDSNFSTIFSIWDLFHKTILLNIPQNKISIGVPAYNNSSDNKFINLITLPFKRQKTYWQTSDKDYERREELSSKSKLFLEE